MKQQSYVSIPSYRKNHNSDSLKQGIWLRWELLTQAEKVVCLGILLIPLWWCIGWGLMLLFWVIGIVAWEIKNYRTIRLGYPSISVIALILFSLYQVLTYVVNSPEIVPRLLLNPFFTWGSGGILLWYIQNHKIRVRLQVVAWAFSIVICLMVIWWVFFHFVLSEPYYIPPRTLYALLTDKGAYDPSKLGSVGNFLVPYYPDYKGIGELARHTFFFPHPTVSSFAIGFAGLIFLDINKRYFSLGFAFICGFLILIAQTRNAWVAIPIVLIVRWLLTNGKKRGIAFILMLFAITSFITLSLPQVTDYITETYTNTVDTTRNFRKESTEGRQLVYQRTWENFIEEPLVGHGINGAEVLPGYEFAKIGTESFILGTLLYKSGIIGTGLFLTFFTSFMAELYYTKYDRPICSFMMMLYLSLASTVTEFMGLEIFFPLLCTMLQVVNNNKLIKSKITRSMNFR